MHPSSSFLAFYKCQLGSHMSWSRAFGRVVHTCESTCRPSWFSSAWGERNVTSSRTTKSFATYGGKKTTSRRLVNAQQQSYKRDNIILYESLIQKRIEHACTKYGTGGEGQSEHVRYVRASFLLTLQKNVLFMHVLFHLTLMLQMAIYLFHFTQVQRIFIVRSKLHKSHVGTLRQLRNTLNGWKESKNRMGKQRVQEFEW